MLKESGEPATGEPSPPDGNNEPFDLLGQVAANPPSATAAGGLASASPDLLPPADGEPIPGAGAELPGRTAGWLGATLDPAETARQVLALAVPRLADAGAVFVLEPLLAGSGRLGSGLAGGRLVTMCLATFAPEGLRRGEDDFPSQRKTVVFPPETPQARCLVSGQPVRFSLASTGPCTGFLAVPLTARGEVTGLLLLGRLAGRPGYGAPEIAAATELASQAGVCIDNARLFAQERRIAQALQRGLLPRDPPIPVGVDIAHRYRPAGDHLVGGDWYDIVPLAGNRTAIVVGDAMGHGPEAATVMVQLRAAAHALADLDLTPPALLSRLNRMAATFIPGTFATCVSATVDPATGTGVIARAGHLPPVRMLPGGSCEAIDTPPGLPLGLGDASYEAAQVRLPPGTLLALYTDGLVESRTRALDDGIVALRTALVAAAGPLQASCDAIVEALCQRGEDDTTLVLARLHDRVRAGADVPRS